MKKYIVFLLCFIMIPSLISCVFNGDQDTLSRGDDTNDTSAQASDSEIAMQMYNAAIGGEICVFDELLGEIELKSLRFPRNNARLDECKLLTKAILDIDRDGVNEYVIKSPDNDHIILRYYNGKVYSYHPDSSDFDNFNTDGTFYWYDASAAGEEACGLNEIFFDGEAMKVKSV